MFRAITSLSLLLLPLLLTLATISYSEASSNPLADTYLDRGNAKLHKRDLDGAIADLTTAIELKPDYAEAYDYRGNAKLQKRDLDGAIADFTKAITIKPDYAEAYNSRGVEKVAQNNSDGAIADFTKAIA